MGYFDENESIRTLLGDRTEDVLLTIAKRYIGANPEHPYVYRAFNKQGFLRADDYRYEMNLEQTGLQLKIGQFVYVWGKLWMDQPADALLGLSCYSPVEIYNNGEPVYKSNLTDEMFPDRKITFRMPLLAGWNHIVLRFTKTAAGCGGRFGTGSYKNFPFHFITPSENRKGQEGWIYSEPVHTLLPVLPSEGMSEEDTGIRWYPKQEWNEEHLKAGCFGRVFGAREGAFAFGWTILENTSPKTRDVCLTGHSTGGLTVYLNGNEVFRKPGGGAFEMTVRPRFGNNDLIILSECTDRKQWGFEFHALPSESGLQLCKPQPVHGVNDPWLYLGPFAEKEARNVKFPFGMDRVFEDGETGTYWRMDLPDTWVRPYLEMPLFGKWNYPLGVTLHGLLKTGKELGRQDFIQYVLRHIEQCTSFDAYALWDRKQYGAAGVNNQISNIDSLDDCGSFGMTTIMAMGEGELKGAGQTVQRIADYISNQQERLPDGAFYRKRGSADFMKETMWCDDLYMSTPFLSRYTQLTGNDALIQDAAKQFLLYKSYLYNQEQGFMSHVYDFNFNKATQVPWGRGNGWVLFSLTELLTVLPEHAEAREALLRFYRELCADYLKLQGSSGMWHQVLNMPESYEESSCTSMFIYAFAIGVRNGWLEESEPYISSVLKGWEALTRISINRGGNIYGVCRGSGFSFDPLYYKDDLPWLLNDTHGIGIVMLAGVEVLRLKKAMAGEVKG